MSALSDLTEAFPHTVRILIEIAVPELDEHECLLLTLGADLPHYFQEAHVEHLLSASILSILTRLRAQRLVPEELFGALNRLLRRALSFLEELLDGRLPPLLLCNDLLLLSSGSFTFSILVYLPLGLG